ncbi:MAG TPA: hypothetical protein VGF45_14000, partial [Polyangia bacterium]
HCWPTPTSGRCYHEWVMGKLRGTIRKSDLEGGVYQLHGKDGTVYELEGSDPLLQAEGVEVEVEGKVDRDAMSFTMTGPRLKVTAIRRV